MSRKSVLVGTGLLLLSAGTVGATLAILLRHEPTFYRRAAVPPGPERQALSKACFSHVGTFLLRVKDSQSWQGTFGEEEINSYLEEDFVHSAVKSLTLPEHITDPRLVIEPDRVRLGFRYHVGQFSTVVSIDMRIWLAKEESNVAALEIQGMRLGALPVSAQSILERLQEAAESNNVKLSWYRHKGNQVAILRFQDQSRTSVVLENLDLHPGKIFIQGQSLNPGEKPIVPAPAANQ